jgi:hypothetical protein
MPQAQANVPTELDALLGYVRMGIPVFPCNPLDKKPLTSKGFKDATKDEVQIRAWWGRWPNAMIGAPTGPASGMWVVDLDIDPTKKIDGKAALDHLVAQRDALPPTLMTITPRGGRHLIFSWDPGHDIRNSTGRIEPGIDVRGAGGYVCLPPSRNASGWRVSLGPRQRPAVRPGARLADRARQAEDQGLGPCRARVRMQGGRFRSARHAQCYAQHRRLQPVPDRRRRRARRRRGPRCPARGSGDLPAHCR